LNFSYLAAHHFTPAAKRGSQSEFSLQQEEKKQMHVALYCSAFWVYSIASSSGSHSIFFLQLQLLTSAFLGFQVSRKQNACEESTKIIVTQKSSHTLAVTTTPGSGTAPCSSCLLTSTVGLYEPHKTKQQDNNQQTKAMSKPSTHTHTHTHTSVCV